MRFTRQRLNRTLLLRQHLLERTDATPAEMIGHLVGLQAQDTMPPYLSLAARLTHLDPWEVSTALESRELARVTGALRAKEEELERAHQQAAAAAQSLKDQAKKLAGVVATFHLAA